jgi:hypothetical protein
MGSTRHEKSFVDFEQPYEQNVVGLRGIVYFGIGLFILIVITFGLMWALLGVLTDQAAQNADPNHPLMMSDRERLPPEPRLQLAPGFGADTSEGRVNLELLAPQAEYRELRRDWDHILENGLKDPKTGVVSVMPIETAKEKFLGQNVKARSGPEAEKLLQDSRANFSDSSSGRLASERQR